MKKIAVFIMMIAILFSAKTYARGAEEYIVPLKVVKESSRTEESMGAKAIRPEVRVIKEGNEYKYIFDAKSMNYKNLNGHLTNLFYLNNGRKEALKTKAQQPYETSFTVSDTKKESEMIFAVWVDAMDEIMGGTPGSGEQKVLMILDWNNAKASKMKSDMEKNIENKDLINIKVNGKKIKMDTVPYINNGRTMVPVRFISEELKLNVDWNEKTRTVIIQDQNQKAELVIGSDNVKKDNANIKLESPAEIRNGRTFVPVRAIAEIFNSEAQWDQVTKTVIINK